MQEPRPRAGPDPDAEQDTAAAVTPGRQTPIAATAGAASRGLAATRQDLLDRLVRVFLFVGVPPAILIAYQYIQQGAWLYVCTMACSVALTVVAAFMGDRYHWKGGLVLCAVALLPIMRLVVMGLAAPGFVLVILVVLMAQMLWSTRAAVLVLAFFCVVMAVVGHGHVTGTLPADHLWALQLDSPRAWMVNVFVVAVICVLTLAMFRRVVISMEEGLVLSEGLVAKLEREMAARDRAESERTAAEGQVRHGHKLESLGRMAGGVAHDFNNTLTVIMASAEALRDGPRLDPETRTQMLLDIESAARSASVITHQLLGFGRRTVLHPEAFPASKLVEDTERMVRRLLPANVTIETGVAPGVHSVHGDQAQLLQCMLNLAINARDAMPGGGTLRIHARPALPAEVQSLSVSPSGCGHIRIEVSDDGTGMDAQTLACAFDPFFTTKPEGEGSGLGLSSVHGVVEQSGGTTLIDTAPGQGCRVYVYLPAIADAEPSLYPPEIPVERRPGLHALVIEDQAQVRAVIVRGLRRMGYELLEASDGQEGLALIHASRRRFDLLCTDVVMPGPDGGALAEVFKQRWPGAAVLVCSGYAPDDELRAKLATGALAFLPKPFTESGLAEAVGRVMALRDTSASTV